MLNKFLSDESGQGMVEYALIIALIAVVVIGVLTAIGNRMNLNYEKIENSLNQATP